MGGTQTHLDVCFPALHGEKRLKEEKHKTILLHSIVLCQIHWWRARVRRTKRGAGVSYTMSVKVKRREISNRHAFEEKWRKQKKSRMNFADGQETCVSVRKVL